MNETENKISEKYGTVFNCLASGVIGMAAVLALMLVTAVLISHAVLPAELSDMLTLACVLAGGIAAGLTMKHRQGRGAIPMGCAGGACLAAIIAIVTALRVPEVGFDVFTLKLLICGIIGGAVGGTLKINRKKHKKKKRRK